MNALAAVGRAFLLIAQDTGGMALIVGRATASLVPPRVELEELVRNLHRFGVRSVPIVMATAFLTGVIVVLQAGVYVERYGATALVGWGAGFATFREIGPVLIALMFSGRVGSNNTAELATMTITEQIDALRALAIDPYAYLVIPRVFAMVIACFALTVIGDCLAIVGASVEARLMVGVSLADFWASFSNNVLVEDLTQGLYKSAAFGWAVGVVSCHYGLSVRGGTPGVGRAVNRSVVAAAVAIVVLDYFLTYLLA